ncbi:MAG: tyrosine-type recombinase/integrase [Treponema sp.]|nr:tyrosine-type recombinase/integrase [Treponema sp.]
MTQLNENDLNKIKAAMQVIYEYNLQLIRKHEPEKYYFEKVKNKKLGYVLYVRYRDNGVVVPSHWTTKTNDMIAAEQYAIENREILLNKYYGRDNIKKPCNELYSILRKYYTANSEYLENDISRGKSISSRARTSYHNFITRQFIPYLKKNKITDFEQIDVPLLARFQNQLLKGTDKEAGLKPQTIKIYLWTVSNIFNNLVINGELKINPCKNLVKIKIKKERIRGCYEITKLKRVFNKTWRNQLYYLLCIVIYTTGMRNSEIERIRVKDLIVIDKVHFINIIESKTENGIRIVPLHDFVYRKIMCYVRKNKKKDTDLIFKNEGTVKIMSKTYERANLELAEFTKYTQGQLLQENITFYSGRHFWKTLMDSEKLGDIEEYFMGHKVSANVAKRYNHKDKQGRKKLLERAKKVFQILDKYIFV